jgi:hypothetical protein
LILVNVKLLLCNESFFWRVGETVEREILYINPTTQFN